jgi:hypothetical protein
MDLLISETSTDFHREVGVLVEVMTVISSTEKEGMTV